VSDQPPEAPRDRGATLARQLDVTVVTGDRVLYQGPALEVSAPAQQGMVSIRLRHAALLAALQPGELDVTRPEGTEIWAVGGGFLEVIDDRVTILADTAERAEEIDLRRAEEAFERARLRTRRRVLEGEIEAAQDLALRRSRVRIAVARKALQKRT